MGRKNKQRKAIKEGDTPSLPCDIIYRILSKLPVESLLRFRCVCKSWRLVISEPQFIKTHLNESIKLDRQRLFCPSYTPDDFFSIVYEISDNSETEILYFPLKKYSQPQIRCSCNGLVLLSDDDDMCVLWNPSTRAYTKLSCPFYFELCGLCYDSSIDDYKVVLITTPPDGDGDGETSLYVVFSFKGKSWTQPRKFPYILDDYDETGVNLNGLIHFIVQTSPEADRITYAIVLFDAVNEKFKELPLPPPICISQTERDRFGLMVVKGCLGLYCNTCTNDGHQAAEIWVMKEHEHGEMNSWIKLMIIPLVTGNSNYWSTTKLLCVTKKGEIVMMFNDGITIQLDAYNPKENKYREIGSLLGTMDMLNPILVVPFVDSLVLPTLDSAYTLRKRKNKGSR